MATATPAKSQAAGTEPCLHCGLPSVAGGEKPFCCNGCRAAYELIHGWGLDDYYALRDQQAAEARPASDRDEARYRAFDNEAFLGQSAPQPAGDGLLSAKLAIHGLHCGACAWLLENAAARTPGWSAARVKMADHTIRILFDPAKTSLARIAALIGRLGYELVPLSGRSDQHVRLENRRLLTQIAIAGFCAANAMWIAVALYAGDIQGVLAEHRMFLRLFGTGLGLVAVVIPGRTFFQGAIASLRTRTPHMDLPVALGLSVGSIAGVVNVLTDRGDVYFDSLAVLVFLLLIGRWIQFRQQHRAAKAVDLLLRVTPRHAELKQPSGAFEMVLADSLQPGDIVRVVAGDSVPADGWIESGDTLIDRSLLTGESRPVPAGVRDEVSAGTVNLQSNIEVRVGAIGEQSRIGKVMKSVEAAMAEKTPVVQLADRIGGVFVITVTALAGIAFAAWVPHGWSLAASHATALLIVACPCALALATPLAIAVSLGRAAKRQVLIRDGGVFQWLSRPGQIWFDKTGTLTAGRMTAEYVTGDRAAVQFAAAVERECRHPIAQAVVELDERETTWHPSPPALRGRRAGDEGAALRSTSPDPLTQAPLSPSPPAPLPAAGRGEPVRENADAPLPATGRGEPGWDKATRGEPGSDRVMAVKTEFGGVSAHYAGHDMLVGNLNFLESKQVKIDRDLIESSHRAIEPPWTPIYIAIDGQLMTVLKVSDPLRPTARTVLDQLRSQGWQIGILSGDHVDTVHQIAAHLGVDRASARGGLSPEEKLQVIRAEDADRVVMVGDGANDAAALAAANVGIAVRGGAEVSLQAAPVFVSSGKLSSIIDLMHGSRRTMWLIATAFAVSLAYNLAAVGLAMAGQITPLTAAILMPISSVSVLALTLAWPTFRSDQDQQPVER